MGPLLLIIIFMQTRNFKAIRQGKQKKYLESFQRSLLVLWNDNDTFLYKSIWKTHIRDSKNVCWI